MLSEFLYNKVNKDIIIIEELVSHPETFDLCRNEEFMIVCSSKYEHVFLHLNLLEVIERDNIKLNTNTKSYLITYNY